LSHRSILSGVGASGKPGSVHGQFVITGFQELGEGLLEVVHVAQERDGEVANAGQVRFGFAGKGLWEVLDALRDGPADKGVIPVRPTLQTEIKFFGRHKGGAIRARSGNSPFSISSGPAIAMMLSRHSIRPISTVASRPRFNPRTPHFGDDNSSRELERLPSAFAGFLSCLGRPSIRSLDSKGWIMARPGAVGSCKVTLAALTFAA
jgi:hypothetical protein